MGTLEKGRSWSAVVRLIGVMTGAVCYHRKRRAADTVDGRTDQDFKVLAPAEAISYWRRVQKDGRINLANLHAWLRHEHYYSGRLRSLQRCWKVTFRARAVRAKRRAETSAGRRRRWNGWSSPVSS